MLMPKRLPIAPVLIPHLFCASGCPYCAEQHGEETAGFEIPTADDVQASVERVLRRAKTLEDSPEGVELAFFGGDLWQLPRGPRTELLDAAEREVRRGRAVSIRLTLSPQAVLRAPLQEFRARGVRTVELPIHSLSPGVMRALGVKHSPKVNLEAVGRLHRARVRSIVHLTPGLPFSSHRSALASVEGIVKARPDGARVLPALALSGTLLGNWFQQGRWDPMTLSHAISTSKHVVGRLRDRDIEIVRVGLQPGFDLAESPEVLAGPHHHDLRLLVEAEIMRDRASRALTSVFSFGTRAFSVVVHPQDEGKFRGPENCNLHSLTSQFRLDHIHVLVQLEQPRGSLRVFPGKLSLHDIPRLPKKRQARAS
jgi:histone acetyltransferase (RNA polymerase elongator complex component)